MNVISIIKSRRSIRRFSQEKLDRQLLMDFIEAARCAPAGANIQSLEYVIVDEPKVCNSVFETLAWAGHVKPKRTPGPNQRPVAYITVLSNSRVKEHASVDAAAAIENILIAAWSKGVGSCWLGSIDRKKISNLLAVESWYKVDSVIALGKPAEIPVVEDAKSSDTKYYLDEADVLHVPKRPTGRIAHFNKFNG